jgi:hypothetical protein
LRPCAKNNPPPPELLTENQAAKQMRSPSTFCRGSTMICLIFTQKKYLKPWLFHPSRIRNTILQLCCAATSLFENIVLGFEIPSERSVFISRFKQIWIAVELP